MVYLALAVGVALIFIPTVLLFQRKVLQARTAA
jgi:hypothetical protein